MRRVFGVLGCLALLAAPGSGQVISSLYPYYIASANVVDSSGNLLVFDTSFAYYPLPIPAQATTSVTSSAGTATVSVVTTSIPVIVRQAVMPKTKITVLQSGTGKPVSREYSASFQIVGAGKHAVYAIMTEYSTAAGTVLTGARKLVTINAGVAGEGLPADLALFPSAELRPIGEVTLSAGTESTPDSLFNVDPATNIQTLAAPSNVTFAPNPRIARTMRFDGVRFTTTDVTIP